MKIKSSKILFLVLGVAGVFILLNLSVTTRQGVDYKLRSIRIPLYLKTLDFFDRYYNYRELVKRIVQGANNDEEKVMRIFSWTHNNIRKAPKELPVVDDHVWHIIIRGYGVKDQSQDVFTALCNIAGVKAFFSGIYAEDNSGTMILSFVKMKEKWYVFDAYNGVYFKDRNGRLADIGSKNDWLLAALDVQPDIDYAPYLNNLPTIKDIGLSRSSTQSPLNRLLFEIKKILR